MPDSIPGHACRVRSFPCFSPNSRKYGLGSLRKIPTEGTPLISPGPTSGQLALILQPNTTLLIGNAVLKYALITITLLLRLITIILLLCLITIVLLLHIN